jgi:hypothetical protein
MRENNDPRPSESGIEYEMKYIVIIFFLLVLLFLIPQLFAQALQHDAIVANISVPLRVFDGDRFVGDLTLSDLELYEDGKLQRIRGLYLTRQATIERSQAGRDFSPNTARRFYFLFQITDFNPQITEAMDHFFTHVYQPDDQVVIMTPVKNYMLSQEAFEVKARETVVQDVRSALRRDTSVGASEYNSLIRDLKKIVQSLTAIGTSGERTMYNLESSDSTVSSNLGYLLTRYHDALQRLEELRLVDEGHFIRFAAQLKRLDEQKIVFFFYQREFRPEIEAGALDRLLTFTQSNHIVQAQLRELFHFYHREVNLSVTRLRQAFSDASIVLNLIYLNKQLENISGIYMREQSEDVFKVFSQVAASSGGIVDTSQNPAAAFAHASALTDRGYLLYYSPETYVRDGGFRNILVRVKGREYRVLHRQGYYAN